MWRGLQSQKSSHSLLHVISINYSDILLFSKTELHTLKHYTSQPFLFASALIYLLSNLPLLPEPAPGSWFQLTRILFYGWMIPCYSRIKNRFCPST